MLLSITYRGTPATDLGHLLHKNPYRPQSFGLNPGTAHVFYPEISDDRATAALMLEINPIDLVRGKGDAKGRGAFDYVNDRPYVPSSFMSMAISRVFNTAMAGRADGYQELADAPLDLQAELVMLPCRGDRSLIDRLFEPLGYEVDYETFAVDERFPSWGEAAYVNLTIRGNVRLRDLLRHLYVLIPVFDRQKHYWVGADEVEKLLRAGAGWLEGHPENEVIAREYLKRQRSLMNMAIKSFEPLEDRAEPELGDGHDAVDPPPSAGPRLNDQRFEKVLEALRESGAANVIDLGCGEGKFLKLLAAERQFSRIAGMDVSASALDRAAKRLDLDHAPEPLRKRVKLFQGSLTYKDPRLEGYDAACIVEVVEHVDPPRLASLERVVFEFARPATVIVTTPNKEYNANYGLPGADEVRHDDHRFEWTREEFGAWAAAVADRFGYKVRLSGIGEADAALGAPTQMGVFEL